MASTSPSSMANVLITPEDVLESLMNDGTIDAIRLKIITQLKANEELKNNIITMVEQSKVLNTPGAEKQTKRELFDSLRQELEIPALERASKSVWESILDSNGLGKEINETVENVFCRLSGREPPLFPPSHNEVNQDHVKDKENSSIENENEHLDSPSKNKNLTETSGQMDESEAAEGLVGLTSVAVDSVPDSSTVAGNSVVAQQWRCQRTDGKNWQCKNKRVPDSKYCEKHMLVRSKRPKIVAETTNTVESRPVRNKKPKIVAESGSQGTESRPVRIKGRLKKQVESGTKQGTLIDIMVESSRNIISTTSMPSPSQDTDSSSSSQATRNNNNNASSPRLGSSPKTDPCDKEPSF